MQLLLMVGSLRRVISTCLRWEFINKEEQCYE